MAKAGRKSIYTEQLATQICERLACGESLRTICLDSEMPSLSIVLKWLADNNHPGFLEQYTRAREAQADRMAEDILQIADDGLNDTYEDEDGNKRTDQDVIARSRLRVDARKWLASKMAPKKYGEKLTQELVGAGGGPIQNVNLTPSEFKSIAQELLKTI
jgi:hypothetical protein